MLIRGVGAPQRALRAAVEERDEALRQSRVLATAASELNATLDPHRVIATAVRLAAEMASPPGLLPRRANYCRIDDGIVRVDAEFDPAGNRVGMRWPLREHPQLAEVVRTRVARSGPIDPANLGPTVRAINHSQAVAHAGWVPVVVGDELHGVIAVAGRNRPLSAQELARCVTIVQIMELALANALAHHALKRAALSDPLTSLANRRGLREAFSERHAERPFTVLAIDIDGLKAVNDRDGHVAGDELLVTVADAIGAVMRDGDVVARVGGDEFICVLFDADEDDGVRAAARALDAVRLVRLRGYSPRASIGVAHVASDQRLGEGIRRADAAMYAAKREGGMRYRLAAAPVDVHLPVPSAAV